MATDEERFVLFDINELSDVEKAVILVLGDDIENKGFYSQSGNTKIKYLDVTMQLINQKYKYTREEIFEGLSLMCLKDLIGMNNRASNISEEKRSTLYNTMPYMEGYFLHFIELILSRLEQNELYLNDTIDFSNQKFVEPSRIDRVLSELDFKTPKKLKVTIDNKLISGIQQYREQKNHRETVELNCKIRLAEFFLSLCDYSEQPDDILIIVARRYFDMRKVLEVENCTYLTSYKNDGICGVQVYRYIEQMNIENQLNQQKENIKYLKELSSKVESDFPYKINDLEKVAVNLFGKINKLQKLVEIDLPVGVEELETKVNQVKNKVDSNLLRNIQIITIFIAVITLIIGNVSFLPQISQTSTVGIASFILLINGCMLAGISVLILLISKVIIQVEKTKGLWAPFMISMLFLVVGIALFIVV